MTVMDEWTLSTNFRMRELRALTVFGAGLLAPLVVPFIRELFVINVFTRLAYILGLIYIVKRFKAG